MPALALFPSRPWLGPGVTFCCLIAIIFWANAKDEEGCVRAEKEQAAIAETPLQAALAKYRSGLALLSAGSSKQVALRRFREALECDPTFWPAKIQLEQVHFVDEHSFKFAGTEEELSTPASTLYAQGRLDQTIKRCQDLLLDGTGAPYSLRKRLVTLCQERVGRHPNPVNYIELGSARACMGDDHGARVCFDRVLQLGPVDPELHLEDYLYESPAVPDPPASPNTIVRMDLSDWQSWALLERARVSTLSGRTDEAVRQYRVLLDLDDFAWAEIHGIQMPNNSALCRIGARSFGCMSMPEPWYSIACQWFDRDEAKSDLAAICAEQGDLFAAINILAGSVALEDRFSENRNVDRAKEVHQIRSRALLAKLILAYEAKELCLGNLDSIELGKRIVLVTRRTGIIPQSFLQLCCLDLSRNWKGTSSDSVRSDVLDLLAQDSGKKHLYMDPSIEPHVAWRWLTQTSVDTLAKSDWYLEETLRQAQKFPGKDDRLACVLVAMAGQNCMYQSKVPPQMGDLFEPALAILNAEGHSHKELLAYTLTSYGAYSYNCANYGKAVDLYKQACDLFGAIGQPDAVAKGQYDLGWAYLRAGNARLAMDAFRDSAFTAQENGNEHFYAQSLRLAAKLANRLYDADAEKLDQALLRFDVIFKDPQSQFEDLVRIIRRKRQTASSSELSSYLKQARTLYDLLMKMKNSDAFGSGESPISPAGPHVTGDLLLEHSLVTRWMPRLNYGYSEWFRDYSLSEFKDLYRSSRRTRPVHTR